MKRIRLALNVNGCWEESELFPKLHEIIDRFLVHFDALPVLHESADDVEIGLEEDTLRS